MIAILSIVTLLCIVSENKTVEKNLHTEESCIETVVGRSETSSENKCPSISAYLPKSITLKSLIFNNFPIKEQIICNNGQAYLHCPADRSIRILSAFYGLQSSTICSNISSNFSLTCFYQDTLEKIKNLCNDTNYCLISASTRFYGDPCPGIDKQMIVHYQCIPFKTNLTKSQCSIDKTLRPVCPNSNSTTLYQKIWCEPSTLKIRCPVGKVIHIICGFYGIDPNYDCEGTFKSGSEPTYCYSHTSTNKLISSCSGKQNCVLKGDPNFVLGANFENVCPGYAKILLVQWKCVEAIEPEAKLQKINSNKINFCKSSYEPNCFELFNFFPTLLDRNSHYLNNKQIICDNSRVVLSCPKNLKLFINSAFYGHKNIFGINDCSFSERQHQQKNNTECFSIQTLKKIKTQCDNKTTCLVNVYSNRSEDICPNLAKKMLLEYQCIPSQDVENLNNKCLHVIDNSHDLTFNCGSLNESVWEIVANGSWAVNITCNPDQIINVECAFFGYHPIFNNYLNQTLTQTCFYKNFTDLIRSKCELKNSCFFSDNDIKNWNYCQLNHKILFYKYKCVN